MLYLHMHPNGVEPVGTSIRGCDCYSYSYIRTIHASIWDCYDLYVGFDHEIAYFLNIEYLLYIIFHFLSNDERAFV